MYYNSWHIQQLHHLSTAGKETRLSCTVLVGNFAYSRPAIFPGDVRGWFIEHVRTCVLQRNICLVVLCSLNPSKFLMCELSFHGFNTHRSTPQQNIVSIISTSLKSPIDTMKPCYGLYTYSMYYTPSKTSCNNEQSVIRFCTQYRHCSVVLLHCLQSVNAILIILAL